MSKIGNYVVSLQESDAYHEGYTAGQTGKHLIVPDLYNQRSADREAWTLGWNHAWQEENAP